MTNEIVKITEIYRNYGFDYRPDLSEPNSFVFTITQGVFDNAIILSMAEETCAEDLESELSDLGFHVKKEKFLSIKKTEESLFAGFFSVKKTKAGFKKDYDSHIANIIKSFPADGVSYDYIKSPFVKNSDSFGNEDDILKDIYSELSTDGPKLILVEAAAGFGKTCTAYEVGKLISGQNDDHIVLFAELSRDRQAKIFNHVLYKEVARSFPAVSPDLVIREIKNGKIIVILDGFDELLNEREDERYQFEKSQAMLETIGKILEQDAKVVLTTRKTAILQGDDFDEWVSGHSEDFAFTRYSLKPPSIRSWLSYERHARLEESRVNIKNLSNPVLLTFLRFISDGEFADVLANPNTIVDKYFLLLLNREIERQTLELSVAEQSNFMKRLAQYMIQRNFTRDSKESIVKYFAESEVSVIELCRSRYRPEARPTFEEMLEKLSNHALLDRSSIDEKIGFVNNFVLGHFVAMDLMETSGEWLADSIFLEAAVNAYSSRTMDQRNLAWTRLTDSLQYATDDERVRLELSLLDQVSGSFNESQFNEIVFDTHAFFNQGDVTSCYFNECTFKNCTFDFSRISNCTFISCYFYECLSVGGPGNNEFISPHMDETSEQALLIPAGKVATDGVAAEADEVKKYILEKFWPVGKDTVAFAHRPMFIFYRGGAHPAGAVTTALDELRRDGVIVPAKRKNWVGLDLTANHFVTIKEILGR
ncbi:NACHT domain-containing protein [Pseudomonas viridiflava]|uniref:NACHT domain-containing protein n=1 Tax=Pseudomonas viridiflava TaxID=33069 RepID=UPI000F03376C|nr:hypothetical protein [Pseudomonas viridiflava]